MNFREAVESLYEAKVKPLESEEFLRQMKEYIIRAYGDYEKTGSDFKTLAPEEWAEHLRDSIHTEMVHHYARIEIWPKFLGLRSHRRRDQYYDGEPDDYDRMSDDLDVEAKKRGWFRFNVSSTVAHWQFLFQPNYGKRVQPPRFLYHLSPEYSWSGKKVNIGTQGIKPHAKTGDEQRHFPPRVYLFTDINTAFRYGAGWRSAAATNEFYGVDVGGRGSEPLLVWEIDTNGLRGMNFYEDPEITSGEAVWTYSHIPASAVTEVDKI